MESCNLLTNRYGSLHKDHTVTHITCDSSLEINKGNIKNVIDKKKQYDVQMTGTNNVYSILVYKK